MVKLYAFKLLSVRRHRDWIPTNITILYFRASCRIRTNDLLIARVGKNRTFIFPNYRVQFNQFYSDIQVSCTTTVLRRQLKVKVNYLYRRTPRSWFLLKAPGFSYLNFCDLGGTRTHGSYIKSVILYQLSYEVILRKANNKSLLILSVSFYYSFQNLQWRFPHLQKSHFIRLYNL